MLPVCGNNLVALGRFLASSVITPVQGGNERILVRVVVDIGCVE